MYKSAVQLFTFIIIVAFIGLANASTLCPSSITCNGKTAASCTISNNFQLNDSAVPVDPKTPHLFLGASVIAGTTGCGYASGVGNNTVVFVTSELYFPDTEVSLHNWVIVNNTPPIFADCCIGNKGTGLSSGKKKCRGVPGDSQLCPLTTQPPTSKISPQP